jgi:hypothetical protein
VRRRLLLLVTVGVLLVVGAGVAVATSRPVLRATGPTSVEGTPATATFTIGDRTIRQVRYVDDGTLVYSFSIANDGRLPVTVTGLAPVRHEARLFHYRSLTGPDGKRTFTVGAGDTVPVHLAIAMHGCETLSARAGSFATEVVLRTTSSHGLVEHEVTVPFTEDVHTGSPREVGCARATATSRPPG